MSLHISTKYIRLLSSRLRNFKQKKDDLFNFSCPFCGDSQKNPRRARGFVYRKNNDLFYRCYNCPVSTNIDNLIEHVDPFLFNEYIMERYMAGETGKRKSKPPVFNFQIPKFDIIPKIKIFEHAEWCSKLSKDHSCVEYILSRKLPLDILDKLLYTKNYKLFLETNYPSVDSSRFPSDERLIIPFFDVNNEITAFTGRSLQKDPLIRYSMIKITGESKPVFGMERVNQKEPVKVVEGPIDSFFLKNCVATADANLATIFGKLDNGTDILLIFDNENRNKEIVRMMEKCLLTNRKVVIWPDNIKGKDINQMVENGMTVEQIEDVISKNTFSGVTGLARLMFWKKI